jgi:hypothetical protein
VPSREGFGWEVAVKGHGKGGFGPGVEKEDLALPWGGAGTQVGSRSQLESMRGGRKR